MPPARFDACLRWIWANASRTWDGRRGCRALGGGANSERGVGFVVPPAKRRESSPFSLGDMDRSLRARLVGEPSMLWSLRLRGDALEPSRPDEGGAVFSCCSLTSRAVTHSDLTISKARKPRISTMSSFGLTSRYAPKLMNSRKRRAGCQRSNEHSRRTLAICKRRLAAI